MKSRWREGRGGGRKGGQLEESLQNIIESSTQTNISPLDDGAQDRMLSNVPICLDAFPGYAGGVPRLQLVLGERLCLRVRGRKECAKYRNLCPGRSVVSMESFQGSRTGENKQ